MSILCVLTPEMKPVKPGFSPAHKPGFTGLKTGGFTRVFGYPGTRVAFPNSGAFISQHVVITGIAKALQHTMVDNDAYPILQRRQHVRRGCAVRALVAAAAAAVSAKI